MRIKDKIMIYLSTDFSHDITWLVLTFHNMLSSKSSFGPTEPESILGDILNEQRCTFQIDLHFMKKIPAGAEACNVLVGEVDFLNRPTVAFVRLSPAVLLSGLAEVPIATRYVPKIYSKCSKSGDYGGENLGIWLLFIGQVFLLHVWWRPG